MKEKAIQLLFETAIEAGVNRTVYRAMRDFMAIIDPSFDLGPVDKYYNEQIGGHSDYVGS